MIPAFRGVFRRFEVAKEFFARSYLPFLHKWVSTV